MDFAVKNSKTYLIVGIFLSTIFLSTWVSADKNIKVITLTLMQMGDLHGELQSGPNLREDAVGSLQECGVARLYTVIEQIRSEDRHALLFNIGDTLQGGAEFLFTQGQAIVDIFDKFKINAYASGNWDFLYGKRRYLELFRKERWGAVGANLYDEDTGERVLPPFRIIKTKGIKVGVIGLTTSRGIPAIPGVSAGLFFTSAVDELPPIIDELRNVYKVDVLVLLSEQGIAKNIVLAEMFPGIDIVMSADMHEETPNVVVAKTGTLLSEVGEQGAHLSKYVLTIEKNKATGESRILDRSFNFISVNELIKPNKKIQKMVDKIRKPFVAGSHFVPHLNPINGSTLDIPIDTVVGYATIGLYRNNFSHHSLPGAVEGTSHDFLTDAYRHQADSDFGILNGGFRFGTHVPPGPIRLEQIFHFLPAGAQLATGTVKGQALKNVLENMIEFVFVKDPLKMFNGWLFAYSGVKFDLDLSVPKGSRAINVKVLRQATDLWEPLSLGADYTVAGHYYDADPNRVGPFRNLSDVSVLTREDGSPKDVTESIVDYLKTHDANPVTGRIHLLHPLPPPIYGNPEVQPLNGAASNI
jgi:sulfur-oxidizing protein SoxB